DSQGFFIHPDYGKQSIYFLGNAGFDLGFSKGSKLPLKILRNKKEIELKIPLKSFPYKAVKIPYRHYFGRTPYFTIVGGFMFTELTEFFLREWGSLWRSKVDKKLLYLNDYHKMHLKKTSGKYILLVQVLPDESNNGYHNITLEIVESVDGKKVKSVKELQRIISKSEKEIIGIKLENGVTVAINKKKLDKIDQKISEKFSIPILKNFK
ncbi:MAG: serine protease, partial [Leptospiraceae bacterium]|nr:serine protease [Leptospiraceae bacterium]